MKNIVEKKVSGSACCCDHCAVSSLSNAKIKTRKSILYYARFIIGAVLFVLGFLLSVNFIEIPQTAKKFNIELLVCLISYLLIGFEVVLNAIKNILKMFSNFGETSIAKKIFDENFLMTLATVGAFAIGEYPEAVAVMLFYRIGEAFEEAAVDHSRSSITDLLNIKSDWVNVKTNEGVEKVKPEEVSVGTLIVVTPGEKIPLDGIVVEGNSSLDTSALTGESMPRDVSTDTVVISGSVNLSGLLTVRTTKTASESTVSKILELVENSESRKTKAENFITKFSRYYTPIVVIAAVMLAFAVPLIFKNIEFKDSIHNALIFLVVSCPCALVISIPLGFFGGIGGASKHGILIKGSNYLDALNKIDTVVFDKTGTLTTGKFKVKEIVSLSDYTKEEVLKFAAYAEYYSKHPAAVSICEAFTNDASAIDVTAIKDMEEIPGCGIRASVNGKIVLAGNKKILEQNKIVFKDVDIFGQKIYIAIDGIFAGCIHLSDELKASSKESIIWLKKLKINVMMLSGDTNEQTKEFARQTGIENYRAELLPQDKLRILEQTIAEKNHKKNVVFVGDGINDAPSLARSDVGVAIGAFGTDAAMEAADIVLLNGETSTFCKAIIIAGKTHAVVMQNIVFAIGVKAAILILGAIGAASIWLAVFGDVGVAFLAILNSVRNLYNCKRGKF
ncbi:MAG: heavy metal translocating P-type ATPase [Termitinemataceae bacterium]|nr:MAG: heavy metal translocating P-type ATPase [Termitinemataceae bacterium]